MVGMLQFAANTSVFNGGRSQIQPWFIQGSATHPFLNAMKGGTSWAYVSTNAAVNPAELDSDGYPTSLPSGSIYSVFTVPSQTDRPGNYVATWDGNGTIYMNHVNTLVSGSKTSSTGSGRYVFSTTSTTFNVGIQSITSPAITNMKVYHIDDEPAILAGQVFGTKFKSLLAESKCGVFRFLDWIPPNGNTTTWATRKPVSYVFWDGREYRPSLYAGVTTNSGNDYSITFGSGAPTDKQTIHIRFNANTTYTSAAATFSGGTTANSTAHGLTAGEPIGYVSSGVLPTGLWQGITYYVLASGLTANSFQFATTPGGSPVNYGTGGSGSHFWIRSTTLNLNGTGAVPIKSQFGDILQTNESPRAVNGGGATIYGTLVYDAALNCWLKDGADTNTGSRGINNGIPPEICLQLCSELRMHPYFVTPYLTVDPVTDYMSSLASLVKNSGPSWMIPRFETPNETWNSATGFYSTRYAWNKSFLSWGIG